MLEIFFLLGLLKAVFAAAPSWHHNDQAAWATNFPACGGMFQSPIDIDKSAAVLTSFPPILFSMKYFDNIKGQLVNTGHTLEFQLFAPNPDYYITGGPMGSAEYQFDSFHSHWGDTNAQGAEHTFDQGSLVYPVEFHFVHFNKAYGDIATALTHSDGIVVLTVFYDVKTGVLQPESVERLTINTPDVQMSGQTKMMRINLGQFFQEVFNLDKYFTYTGSLTTPPCSEAVRFIIFANRIALDSTAQVLQEFRLTFDLLMVPQPLVNNFRQTQPLNGRTVYVTFA